MKYLTCLHVLVFSLALVLFFSQSTAVLATEGFDPTGEYKVHSQPQLTTEPQAVLQIETQNAPVQAVEPKIQTVHERELQPSMFSSISSNISQILNSTSHSFQNLQSTVLLNAKFLGTGVRILLRGYGTVIQAHWKTAVLTALVSAAVGASGVVIATNQTAMHKMQDVMKSILGMQVRLGIAVSALFIVGGFGTSWVSVYQQQLNSFESLSGFRLNPLGQDLIVVGTLLFAAVVISQADLILSSVRSIPVFVTNLIKNQNWKKMGTYLVKETKTAFSETEKECKDTIDDCSSPFDKAVIMFFNYLPGTMPDLGIDDAIIEWKNNLFGKPSVKHSN